MFSAPYLAHETQCPQHRPSRMPYVGAASRQPRIRTDVVRTNQMFTHYFVQCSCAENVTFHDNHARGLIEAHVHSLHVVETTTRFAQSILLSSAEFPLQSQTDTVPLTRQMSSTTASCPEEMHRYTSLNLSIQLTDFDDPWHLDILKVQPW